MSDFYSLDNAAQAARMCELARVALAEWGIADAGLQLIKYRENAVIRVTDAGGRRYALRIHRHGYHDDAQLRSELQWIEALAAHGIEVPELLPTRRGELFARVAADAVPEPRQVDLFAWVEGRQLGSVEAGATLAAAAVGEVYRTIGGLAARLHNQASGWTPPPGFSRHAWDADGLAGPEPFWGRFWELGQLEPGERELMVAARERVHRDLAAYAADPQNHDRYSLIHADFVSENLLVDGSHVRLIDFDDAGYGWHLFELATALYFEMGEPHFDAALAALIEGYRRHRDLPARQLEQLPLFFLARSLTYLGWIHTRRETETARTLGPMLIGKACALARDYLGRDAPPLRTE